MKTIVTISILCSVAAFGCNKHRTDDADTTRTTSAIVVEPTLDDTHATSSTEDNAATDNGASLTNGLGAPRGNGDYAGDGGRINGGRDGGVMLGRDRNGESFETSGGSSGLGTPPLRRVPGQDRFDTK